MDNRIKQILSFILIAVMIVPLFTDTSFASTGANVGGSDATGTWEIRGYAFTPKAFGNSEKDNWYRRLISQAAQMGTIGGKSKSEYEQDCLNSDWVVMSIAAPPGTEMPRTKFFPWTDPNNSPYVEPSTIYTDQKDLFQEAYKIIESDSDKKAVSAYTKDTWGADFLAYESFREKNSGKKGALIMICSKQVDDYIDPDKEPNMPETPGGDKDDLPDPPDPTPVTGSCTPDTKYSSWRNRKDQSTSVDGIYEYRTKVTPVRPSNLNLLNSTQLNEWNATHQAQYNPFVKTEYGKLLDRYNSDGTLTRIKNGTYPNAETKYAEIIRNLKEAKERDEVIIENAIANIPLSSNNQRGLSRGGAFTTTVEVREAALDLGIGEQVRDIYKCSMKTVETYTYIEKSKIDDYNTSRCVRVEDITNHRGDVTGYYCVRTRKEPSWRKTGEETRVNPSDTKTYLIVTQDRYYKPYKSSQIIGVVCNVEEGISVITTAGGTPVKQSGHAVLGVTPIVQNREATFFNTSNISVGLFYSNDCEEKITCSPEKTDALVRSDGRNNIGKTNAEIKDGIELYGAQSEGINTSFVQFFRDGIKREIRTDVWTPKSSASGFIKPNSTLRTDIGVNSESTPDPSSDKADLFITDMTTPNRFDRTPWTVSYAGEKNKIGTSAIWASEGGSAEGDAKPIELVYTSHYKPQLVSSTVTSISLKGERGGISVRETREPIPASCYSLFRYDESYPIYAMTGMFPKYVDPSVEHFMEQTQSDRILTINYVKSSAE